MEVCFAIPLISMFVHVVPVTVIWVAMAVTMFSSFDRLQNPKPYYSEFPNSLKVLESRMNWAQTRTGCAST